MAAQLATRPTQPIALIYQAEKLHQHLKAALVELGANVVYETHSSAFAHGALDGSGAEIVVINLDDDGDDFDALGDLLSDETRRVIINDGDVTAKLEGWELARFTRHLAAKLLGVDEVLPQRPLGAQAIPVRVKATVAGAAIASDAPSKDFEIGGHELAAALNADTGARMEATRAELVTDEEPISVAIYQRPTEVAPYAVDADELMQHLPDLPAPMPETAPFELSLDVSEIESALSESHDVAGEMQPVERETQSRHDAPTLEMPGIDLDAIELSLEALDEPQDRHSAPTVEMPAIEMPAVDAPQPASVAADDTLAADDFSFTLSEAETSLLDATSFDDDTFTRLPSAEAEVHEVDFSDIEALNFVDAPDERPREDVPDLDALLRSAGPKDDNPPPSVRAKSPAEAAPVATPAQAPTRAPAAAAPPAAPVAQPAAAPKERTLADFESALSRLSLVEDDDAAPAAPVAEAPKPAAPAPTRDFSSALAGLSLEPIDEDGENAAPQAPVTGRASFGLGTDAPNPVAAAAVAPKPAVAAAPAPKAAVAEAAGDDLSLDALDFEFGEDTEIRADSIVRLGAADAALDDLAVDMDSELDALLKREAELAATPASRIERVWVLGASIGGPDAVREFLAALPADVPATFLLAQHMGADFLDLMVQQLRKATKLTVRVAANGDVASHGEVIVVPLNDAIDIEMNGFVRISPAADQSPYTPSIDRVMRAAADRYGAASGAVIFSGMAHDAIEGAEYIKRKGGTIWVQSPASCVISSMVDGALDAGVVGFQGTPVELAQQFISQVAR